MSGFINVVPLVTGSAYTATSPSTDIGNEGDYALDLNTNILYGPKDSSLAKPWPVGTKLATNLYHRGSWAGWVANAYFDGFVTGDVVHDGASGVGVTKTFYICIKPHGRTVASPGPWSTGDIFVSTVVAGYYALCIQSTTTSYDDMVSQNAFTPGTWVVTDYWIAGTPWFILDADEIGRAHV